MRRDRWAFGVVRRGSVLFPDGERSERTIRELPFNKPLMMEARTARNMKQHNLYWALLDKVVEATGRYPNSNALSRAIKLQLGHTVETITLDGEVRIGPDSIAVSAMAQEPFDDFFKRTVALIAEHFYGDMTAEQIADLETMIAGHWRPAPGDGR